MPHKNALDRSLSLEQSPLKRWLICGVALLVIPTSAAWCTSKLAMQSFMPSRFDNDCRAYVMLTEALETGSWEVVRVAANRANVLATDVKLKDFSSLLSRLGKYYLDAGIDTVHESESWSGGIKSFGHGFSSPTRWFELGAVSTEGALFHWGGAGSEIDSKYQPVVAAMKNAEKDARHIFWGAFVIALVMVANALASFRQYGNTDNNSNDDGCEN